MLGDLSILLLPVFLLFLGLPLLIETDPISGATAPVTLSGLLRQGPVILAFYTKAFTPG